MQLTVLKSKGFDTDPEKLGWDRKAPTNDPRRLQDNPQARNLADYIQQSKRTAEASAPLDVGLYFEDLL